MMFTSTKKTDKNFLNLKSLGFTLIEMMVSISIFAIITAVVLIRNNEFNSGILFSNLVYETALSIREMQTYGITVRVSDSGAFKFQNGYGVYFNKVNDPNAFVQFTDIKPDAVTPPDGSYDGEAEKLFRFKLKPGNFIQEIKVCTGVSCISVEDVAITYIRPEPNAIIKSGANTYTKATIVLQAPATDIVVKKCIVVTSVGQISVQSHNGSTCI